MTTENLIGAIGFLVLTGPVEALLGVLTTARHDRKIVRAREESTFASPHVASVPTEVSPR